MTVTIPPLVSHLSALACGFSFGFILATALFLRLALRAVRSGGGGPRVEPPAPADDNEAVILVQDGDNPARVPINNIVSINGRLARD